MKQICFLFLSLMIAVPTFAGLPKSLEAHGFAIICTGKTEAIPRGNVVKAMAHNLNKKLQDMGISNVLYNISAPSLSLTNSTVESTFAPQGVCITVTRK